MELKKCKRCGCFFTSNNDVCTKCEIKDKSEMKKLKNYLADLESNKVVSASEINTSSFENNSVNKNFCNNDSSIDTISVNTGISVKNLNRYFSTEAFLPKAYVIDEYSSFSNYTPSNKVSRKIVKKQK